MYFPIHLLLSQALSYMEMHAKYFIEHFKKNQKFPIIGIITKNQKGNDSLILDNKNIEINISDLDKAVNPNIVFFNSGRWIEELKNIRDLFPNAKFLYRTGGNEILKAPLIKNNNPSHKLRQSYWAQQINENINVLITNSLYTEKRLAALGIKAPFKRFVGGVNIPDLKKIKYPESILRIIGPTQNHLYYQKVKEKIKELHLGKSIELIGYTAAEKLSNVIQDCHIHISNSNCETFGRSIFETLASGIPNIARFKNNAAYGFLQNLPYVKFISNSNEAFNAIDEILLGFSKLSLMACEIGNLYDDSRLKNQIVAKICNNDTLVISDYDGTLFHQDCHNTTIRYIEKFKQFSQKVICSARSTEDLLVEMEYYNLQVDWIISYSGAITTDGKGNILFINPLSEEEIEEITNLVSDYKNRRPKYNIKYFTLII
ncbi:MAG TPA: glycosyltransferase [Candidatus Megaira endosymbiont of Nemacystus decipiens]|nr:glycosyltransferase [Candidatus Megaera endosymbiont of Nemacystus decipiens]